MKWKELLSHPAVLDALLQNPPHSKFSGKPLTLGGSGEGLSLQWANSMEADWWVGMQDGIYTRQDIRFIADEEIVAVAEKAGLNSADVSAAYISRLAEREQARLENAKSYAEFCAKRSVEQQANDAQSREKFIHAHPEYVDPQRAAAAEAELAALLTAHPHITRMTRKGHLVDDSGNRLAHFSDFVGMKAWLFQHGYRASIDDRHHFVGSLQ